MLLDKHGEGELSAEEQAELRVYAQINEIINLKKPKQPLRLLNRPNVTWLVNISRPRSETL